MLRLSILLGGLNFALASVLAFVWTDAGHQGAGVLRVIAVMLAVSAFVCSAFLVFRARAAEISQSDLRNSKFWLGALFEHSPICMNLKGTDGRYLMVNQAYSDWFDKPAAEIIGTRASSIFHSSKETSAVIHSMEAGVAETGKVETREIKVARAGKTHHRLLVKFPAIDDNGAFVGMGTIALDLTDQKAAEAALLAERDRAFRLEQKHQHAEDLLRNLFDNFGHGIMIRDLDTRLIRANTAALRQTGFSADEIIGKTTSEMFAMMGGDDQAIRVTEQEIGMMERRETDEDLVARTGPDGTLQYIRLSRFPLIDRNGDVQGLGVLRYEVTELIETQKALEASKANLERTILERTEELRISERRFRILAHASADWFWECDADLCFTYLSENFPVPGDGSRSSLLGVSLPRYHELAHDDIEHREQMLAAYAAREQIRDFEARRRVTGVERIYRINATPLFNNGVFEGYAGATADISELYQARESLVESERLASLGAMVAGIAHEINTPVGVCVTAGTTVLAAAHKLRDGVAGGNLRRSEFDAALTKITEGMTLVDSNLGRAAKLISSFKNIAVDQVSEAERTFHLVPYLQEITDSLSPNLRPRKISIDISGPGDLELKSYPGAFAQIVTNLVMNSMLHGFDGRDEGCIAILVSEKNGSVELRYEDDGIGMEEETVKKIFDPFFTTKRGQGGSGLGMHILFNLVTKILRGSVRCSSAPGKGIEIVIRFPLVAAEV